ncbi:MAG TPA: hypothetical protein VNE17_14090 [Nitrolancea sp.]|nr:hypothetical protein [Nitrolancea sp.]
MDELADTYAERGVQSIFLYVREAHPGENFPHHTSFDQKWEQAHVFQERWHCRRPILLDDLNGTAHEAFGRMPNMTYILGNDHRVLFRADWTDASTVQFAVDYLLSVDAREEEGTAIEPFYAELRGFRWENVGGFAAGLEYNGPRAVSEFRQAKLRWSRGEHLGALNKLRGRE